MGPEWIASNEWNLAAESNMERAEQALAAPGAALFGWQYHYAGGCSRSQRALTSMSEYERLLATARPGDIVILYSFDAVAGLATHHRDRRTSHGDVSWRQVPALAFLQVDPQGEGTLVGRSVDMSKTKVVLYEFPSDPDPDDWSDADSLTRALDEVLFFDLRPERAGLDMASDGGPVTSPIELGRPRRYATVEGKVPSPDGLVPMSGPY